ncbi:MAG: RNA-splicing factor [Peltula sp. TS41687]|nr:MAG: RNA-splicing factor [Peltula sp. TS41687]
MEAVASMSTSEESKTAMFKKRSNKSKSNFRKRPATPPPAATMTDSDGSDYSSTEDESGRQIKRRKKNTGAVGASSTATKRPKGTDNLLEATKFVSDRSLTIESTNDATKQSNWYEETGKDSMSAKDLLGSTRTKPPTVTTASSKSNGDGGGTYKGAANYQSFIQKNPNAPSRQMGPIKAPTNIRTITVTDFAPDVCKDYKQTGFCGFGDSCKFLHAREDYKQGWELDREWEVGTKGKKLAGRTVASANRSTTATGIDDDDDGDDDEAALENIPFACIICKKPYRNPIVTKCGHYFCEHCALARYRKNPSCAACGAGTSGVFNGAKNLKKLLDKKRERARKRREARMEEGSEASDAEEDEGTAST